MNIKSITLYNSETLIEKLRTIRLRGFNRPYIYENAVFDIVTINPRILRPAQKYVLNENISNLTQLYSDVLKYSINIFNLRGYLQIETDNDSMPFLPPIVEISDEDGYLINDGMHRVATAIKMNTFINVVTIRNIPKEFPYYSYPLDNGWDDVTFVDTVPDHKKVYRNPDNYKALFRDFNEVFDGVQKKR